MRKKLLIGLLVCGIVGDGGVCAHELWVTPYSLTAEFTGKNLISMIPLIRKT